MATTAAPYGFWATNPTEKLAHWVYLLGQPLSRNRVFQNFSGEPPPLSILIIVSVSFRHSVMIFWYLDDILEDFISVQIINLEFNVLYLNKGILK